MKVIVSNIQRFCLHDGPGIRTTIFFKGCNLRCPWCSNPENINFCIEEYEKDGLNGYYGKEYSLDDLEKIIMKDKEYYGKNGGVTFSGGECLWQFKKIEPLLRKLKNYKINICIETALTVPKEFLQIAINYVDEFYVDIKILNKETENKINGNSELYINNIKYLLGNLGNTNNITLRMPVVVGYTYTKENINEIINILKSGKFETIEIFKTHRFGEEKYKSLGLKMPEFEEMDDVELEELKLKFEKYINNVKIIKI